MVCSVLLLPTILVDQSGIKPQQAYLDDLFSLLVGLPVWTTHCNLNPNPPKG